ncbi:MAG TPA: hypothetical protein VM513_32995 [Kofleriaceae bacterium]|nr:hypothetical protein [Kofleriaceae bacterium]
MIKLLIYLALAAGLAYCGATVKLGKRTFFGHVRAIWATEEVQDLKQGVEEKAGPAMQRVKRGVEAGLSDEAGSGSAVGSAARP